MSAPLLPAPAEAGLRAPSWIAEAEAAIEQRLGLHEEVSIIYVVDGYDARLLAGDGGRVVASHKSNTPIAALRGLAASLGADARDASKAEQARDEMAARRADARAHAESKGR